MGPAEWRAYTGDPAVFYKPGVGPLIDIGVYPLTDEPFEVRRFAVEDPNGVIINIMRHKQPSR